MHAMKMTTTTTTVVTLILLVHNVQTVASHWVDASHAAAQPSSGSSTSSLRQQRHTTSVERGEVEGRGSTLEEDLTAGLIPVLRQLSAQYNDSA
jgi:hypothetical protein